jgi:hypothetical protein
MRRRDNIDIPAPALLQADHHVSKLFRRNFVPFRPG